jgi:hypothetical protein
LDRYIHVNVNMLMFHSSFKFSLVSHIFTYFSVICQGTYLITTARSHATDSNFHEGTIIGNFNGVFFGVYALNQVINGFLFYSYGNYLFLVFIIFFSKFRSLEYFPLWLLVHTFRSTDIYHSKFRIFSGSCSVHYRNISCKCLNF